MTLSFCFIKLQCGILSNTGGEVGSGAGSVRILRGCGAVGDIAQAYLRKQFCFTIFVLPFPAPPAFSSAFSEEVCLTCKTDADEF